MRTSSAEATAQPRASDPASAIRVSFRFMMSSGGKRWCNFHYLAGGGRRTVPRVRFACRPLPTPCRICAAMLVDSHCHLDFPELHSDLDGVLERMSANGVTHALTISTTLETFPAVRAVARTHANVWCSAGVHPDERRDAREVTEDELVAMARDPRVVAIGETGL